MAAAIDGLISKAALRTDIADPLVFILPHAGYIYSGTVAASGYRLMGHAAANPDIIVILGPSHHSYMNGCSILQVDYYETPLGLVSVGTGTYLLLRHRKARAREKRLRRDVRVEPRALPGGAGVSLVGRF